ncbi:MAG: Na+/H+ antiporter subunit G [Pseudomonadota bacterium]
MMESSPVEIITAVLLLIGAFFTLVGGYGLIKINNPMSRLHAPTKAGTLGVGSILIASMIYAIDHAGGSLNELLISVFMFATAPVTAYFIAKVHVHRDRTGTPLPELEKDRKWATKMKPEEDA